MNTANRGADYICTHNIVPLMATLPIWDRQLFDIYAEDQPVNSRFVQEPTSKSRSPRIVWRLSYQFREAEETMYVNHYLSTSRLTSEKPKFSVDLLPLSFLAMIAVDQLHPKLGLVQIFS